MSENGSRSHPWELAWREGRWYEVSPAYPDVVEFSKLLREAGARTVLDFGCGAGRHSIYLAQGKFLVVGFDISITALRTLGKRVRNEYVDDVLIVETEMSRLPFRIECFDGIISTNVLHHASVSEIKRAVAEIGRVLKGGGLGFVTTLSENDYKNGSGVLLEPGTYLMTEGDEQGITHHFFSKRQLSSLFHGFEIVSLKEEVVPIEKGNRGHFVLTFRKH